MKNKIVLDSSSNLREFSNVDFASVPLRVIAGEQEFIDDINADAAAMASYLTQFNGKTSTACPSVGDYLEAFGDAEHIFCITLTSSLSGSYHSASVAAQTYLEQHPNRRIHVFDSLSTGGEMTLLAEKLGELIAQGLSFDTIVEKANAYSKRTRLLFSLESLRNLANNGRVPAAVAKIAGILGIRMIGKASEDGKLQPIGKARGEKRVAPELFRHLTEMGYQGGKVRIDHCCNPSCAEELRSLILSRFPAADILIGLNGILCSFYAEIGGLIVGFET